MAEPLMMFSGIDHFAIASPDASKLAGWYAATLDFEIIPLTGGAYFVEAANGALIEIIPAVGERPPGETRTPGLRHIAIAVHDFQAAFDRLRTKGVSFLGEPYQANGNQLVFFEDADGNLLHLIQRSQPLRRKPEPVDTMNLAQQDL